MCKEARRWIEKVGVGVRGLNGLDLRIRRRTVG